MPDPELVEQAKRRTFTAKYKAEILAKADACTRPGEIGELLRAEGLYTSHLTYWRKQVRDGALKELGKPRGRKPVDRRDQEIARLQRKLERSETELAKMKRVVEIQGKRLSAVGGDARYRERAEEHRGAPRSTEEHRGAPSDDRCHRRGTDGHRHPADVPGGGGVCGDGLPPAAGRRRPGRHGRGLRRNGR